MDQSKITQIIQNEIYNIVPQMIEDALTAQTHNGGDSQRILGSDLANAPQSAVAQVTTTGTFGVDPSTVAAVNAIIVRLQALGLLN